MKLLIEEYGPIIITMCIIVSMTVVCGELAIKLVEFLQMLLERIG